MNVRGKPHTAEAKERMRISALRAWADPSRRESMSRAMRAYLDSLTPEERAADSAAKSDRMHRRWSDPEQRESQSQKISSLVWCHDPVTDRARRVLPDRVPDGWQLGRSKRYRKSASKVHRARTPTGQWR